MREKIVGRKCGMGFEEFGIWLVSSRLVNGPGIYFWSRFFDKVVPFLNIVVPN